MDENMIKRRQPVVEWVETVAGALVIVILLFTFLLRVVTVSGSSMESTLKEGDVLLVSGLMYTPEHGHIVVVDSDNSYGEPLVKRIVGLPGDVVDIDFSSGTVYVNGVALDEPYAAATTRQFDISFPLTVPEGKLFVMGDNRPVSLDSRDSRIGFIDRRDLVGKALFRVFPFNKIGGLS